ncbi:MAG: SpoIIE family protein phosphatase [Planctomycetota bacterium]|nr:MAG: SpoIIE family protein phosphatase [Planctomycetota bacterium]
MKIRWKLLILLLAIALIPLVVVTGLVNRATYRLGDEIGTQAREGLTKRVEEQLLQFVNTQAARLSAEGKVLGAILKLQAQEVERCLALDEPEERKIYFSKDYDEGVNIPTNMATSERYTRIVRGTKDQREPIPISFSEQVFKLASGVKQESVVGDIRRLAMMTPFFCQIYQEHSEFLYWLYVSLENGVHACYPGHGGYPESYDHRKRDWYVRSKSQMQFSWSPPYIEVSTRKPVITGTIPVYRPDGSWAGFACIDVMVSDIVERGKLPKFATSSAKMVAVVPPAELDPYNPKEFDLKSFDPEDLGLFILAQPPEDQPTNRWKTPFMITWLASDDGEEFVAMVKDMVVGKSDVREMSYKGRPSLWAYGPMLSVDAYLVIIVSQDEVIADAVRAKETVMSLTHSQLKMTAWILLVVCLTIAVIAFMGSRTVTEPVRRLAEAARRIAYGDFNVGVNIHTKDELGQLSRTFNEMVPQLRDRLRLRQSLSLAVEVQQHLLPDNPPQIEGLDIAGKSIYCEETGGDYYDFLELTELSPHELGIAVGDVTGHGIAAALLMTGARAVLRSRASQPGSLSDLMEAINKHLADDTQAKRFMTLFYLVIDGQSKSVRWSNAGHDPAIVYDSDSDTFSELAGGEIPLGIDIDCQYTEYGPSNLETGQVIVIGTDGIWETRNPGDEEFGKEALCEIIRGHAKDSANEISQAITDTLAEYRQSRPQEDDVTLVVIKILA